MFGVIDIYGNIGDSLLLNLQHEVPGFEVEFLGANGGSAIWGA
jgi:hypothetical protein